MPLLRLASMPIGSDPDGCAGAYAGAVHAGAVQAGAVKAGTLMLAPMKRLLLIGGGHAHLSVLRMLAYKKMDDVDIVLVTPASYQNYSGMLPGWMAGQYALAQCRIDLLPLAQAARAQVITQSIVAIDAERCHVTLADGREIEYDLLSLDVGSEIDTSSLQMVGEKLLPVKPLDGFFDAWPTVLATARSRSASTQQSIDPNKALGEDNNKDEVPYRLVVVGGGAAGVELALAARHAFSIAQCDARVDLVVGDSGLLAALGTGAQRRAARFLAKADVTVHRCRAIGDKQGVLLSNGTLLTSDCVIAATGARAPAWLQSSGLLLNEHGYIAVDASHRSVSHDAVFAAGDVCARQDIVMARSGVHAVHAGPVLAANLLATLAGTSLTTYRPRRRSLYLLACGPRYAIASWGALSIAGVWVWDWKDRIDRRFIARFSHLASPDGPNKPNKPDRPDKPTTGQGAA
jgi:pyridine nucleotide-disulfide oxidoreductase family protein